MTPIESMLAIDTGDAAAGTGRRARTTAGGTGFSAFVEALGLPEEERLAAFQKIVDARPTLPARAQASLLAPVATGFPAETLARWGRDLGRLGLPASLVSGELPALPGTALQEAERARPAAPIAPGSAVTALLVDGDLQLGATGTVTRVDGTGHFLAFGHPFLGAGTIELPVAPAEVVAVFPSAMLSFKIGVCPGAGLPPDARPRQRHRGSHGRGAPLLPVHFRLESEGRPARTLSWGIAPQSRRFFLPSSRSRRTPPSRRSTRPRPTGP